jgi:hypothetical protein
MVITVPNTEKCLHPKWRRVCYALPIQLDIGMGESVFDAQCVFLRTYEAVRDAMTALLKKSGLRQEPVKKVIKT